MLCIPINSQPFAHELTSLAWLTCQRQGRQARWFVVDTHDRFELIAPLVRRCEAVLSHSYHMALFALSQAVPTLLKAATPYYQLKADGLRDFFGVPAEVAFPAEADSHHLGQQLQQMRERPWSPMGSAEGVDRWLDAALQAVATLPSNKRAA